ncbi:MAG: peptidase [Rhodospirillaceae bacterium]|nr:peptidase [Rhodospirillaceae bacterium]
MTYCVGLKISDGLVFLSDTRTNAGVDNIARFRKMFTWSVKGQRAIAIVTSGNLSITQGVITRLNQDIQRSQSEDVESIMTAETMFRVAQIVSEKMRLVQDRHSDSLEARGEASSATILVGGQRRGGRHRLFQVYAAGNFIEATADTPYFQIGEHKYGKPILDRVLTINTPMKDAIKAAMVSMDSTLRSNLSVGMPLDVAIMRGDTMEFATQRRIDADDPNFSEISNRWSEALRNAFQTLPEMTDD